MNTLEKRIRRISGQLNGIYKMVQDKRDSVEVLQQISAVKRAINGLTLEIIENEMDGSVDPSQKKKMLDLFERAVNL